MSYILKTNFADPSNYGGKRTKDKIKYIVVHYTGNDGDSDESNAKFFKNNKNRGASAHRFVDDDSVTISVPDLYVAYSVGGKKYTNCAKTGGGKYYGKCTNANSISIEMCDTKRNGKYDVTEKTLQNTIDLIKELMKTYNIPIENVIRHFDVNGKQCPAYFCYSVANDTAWAKFKNRLRTPSKDYTLVFNSSYYANRYPDLAANGVVGHDALLAHFTKFGMLERRQACSSFNVSVYRSSNPDLEAAFGDNWPAYYDHYISIGHTEPRRTV